jgi:hypothetical protein
MRPTPRRLRKVLSRLSERLENMVVNAERLKTEKLK